MKVSEFLRENSLSIGDNFRLLLSKLGLEEERYIKEIETKVGEPAKMSKSKGNTVDPEEAVSRYGADTVRLYILFAGPVEKDFEWTDEGVQGAYRFLRRLWDLTHRHLEVLRGLEYSRRDFEGLEERARELRRKTHRTLKRYLQQMESFSFNTAIASIMELLNALQDFEARGEKERKVLKEALEIVLFMLYPITPHICEELWQRLGHERLMVFYTFPEPDENALTLEEVELPVQVNGKLRAVIKVPVGAEELTVKELALKDQRVSQWLRGKELRKVVYIKNKLLNLVV
ncbi:MAG: class I tRNA ligase family protein [Aquificaceae bacterium]|nr:class I tRNA ligase family protein [Aquificaceae bacterium]MCS7197026.1 class I tRNA ligase family protein [Aquificaceae bacterium]MCX7989427.1 class I tRNA ligase family protein [Aquificaceae bacterium]MDW8032684.1 class I tRNA ligase family protein [Aquificaceae bacterium]MDW8295168.1 class I tRNA ligase family protein [Aquificaceae bacterium]